MIGGVYSHPNSAVRIQRNSVITTKIVPSETTQQELAGRSILGSFLPHQSLIGDRELLKKGLTNVCLGASAKGATGLEGMPFKDAMTLLAYLFDSLENQQLFSRGQCLIHLRGAVEQLRQDLGNCDANPRTMAHVAMVSIQKLSAGQRHYIPAGWGKLPEGHAMLIGFQRRNDQLLDITIFNAQNGSEQVQGGLKRPGKTQCTPYLKFEAVPEEILFLTEANGGVPTPIVLENIYTIQNPHVGRKGLSQNTIVGFFAPIVDYLARGDRCLALLTMVQGSGKCTIKAFICLMLEQLQNVQHCKKVHLDLRFALIMADYHALLNRSVEVDKGQSVFMLRASVRTFLGMVHRNVNHLDREAFLTAVATAQELLIYLEDDEKIRISRKSIPRLVLVSLSLKTEASRRQRQVAKLKLPHVAPPGLAFFQASVQPTLGQINGWNELSMAFCAARDWRALPPEDSVIQIDIFFYNLSFLKKINIEHMEFETAWQLLIDLKYIFDIYITAIRETQKIASQTSQNTLLEMIALTYCLACHADHVREYGFQKGYLSEFGLDLFLFEENALADGYDCHEPKILEQRGQLFEFFKPLKEKKILFDFLKTEYQEDDLYAGKIPEADYYLTVVPEFQLDHERLGSLNKVQASQQADERAQLLLDLFESWKKAERSPKESVQNNDVYGQLRNKVRDIRENDQFKSTPGNLPHLFILKELVFICAELAISLQPYEDSVLCGPSSLSGAFCHHGKIKRWRQPLFSKELEQLRQSFGAGDVKRISLASTYFSSGVAAHTIPEILSESRYIIQNSEQVKDVSLDRALRSMAEPEVTIPVLLYECAIRVDLLRDAEYRALTTHLLHKTIQTTSGTHSPLFQAIEEDRRFLQRVNLFTENVYHSWYAKIGVGNEIEEISAIVDVLWLRAELLHYFSEIFPKGHFDDETLHLNQRCIAWLDELLGSVKKPLDTPFSLLTDLFAAKGMLLAAIPVHQAATSQWAGLFYVLARARNGGIGSKYCGQLFYRYILKLRINQPQDPLGFAAEVLNCFGFPHQLTGAERKGWHIEASEQSHTWSFDLQALSISCDGHDILNSRLDFKKSVDFIRLFGERALHCKGNAGNYLIFEDAIWGLVHVALDPLSRGVIRVGREIEGIRYTYVAPSVSLSLNLSLSYDHALWVNNDKSRFLLSDLTSGKRLYDSSPNGSVQCAQGWIFSLELSSSHPVSKTLQKFEQAGHICFWTNERDQILRLPRFCLPLDFYYKEGEWFYTGNPHFHLDLDTDLHWGIDRTINLVDKEGSHRKVLVPVGTIESAPFTPECSIVIPNGVHDSSKATLQFEEFDVEGFELKAKTLQGKIYLAHLYLVQKQYHKAVSALRSISLTQQLDEESLSRLAALLSVNDGAPNAAAVRLIAYVSVKRLKPFAVDGERFQIPFENSAKIYQESSHKVDDKMTLTESERYDIWQDSEPSVERRFLWPKPLRNSIQSMFGISNHIATTNIGNQTEKFRLFIGGSKINEIEVWVNTREDSFIKKYRQCSQLKAHQVFAHAYLVAYQWQDKHEKSALMLVLQMVKAGHKVPAFPPIDVKNWCDVFRKFTSRLGESPKSNTWEQITFQLPPLTCHNLEIHPSRNGASLSALDGIVEFEELKRDMALADLHEKYLKESAGIQEEIFNPEWVFEDRVLTFAEKPYLEVIKHHMAHYHRDRIVARRKLQKRTVWAENGSFAELRVEVANLIQQSYTRENWMEPFILKLANRLPIDIYQLAQREAGNLSQAKSRISIMTTCRAAAQPDWEARFRRLNSTLDDEDLNTLRSAALEYMTEITHRNHLKNIEKAVSVAAESPEDSVAKAEVVEYLKMKREYDALHEPFSLLFEFTSGLRLRKIQLKIIRKAYAALQEGKFGYVFQLIMNAGKSSVILSALMELIFDLNLLPAMVCQAGQYASAKGNMLAFQKNRFEKDVISLDAPIADLNDPRVLKDLLARLDRAKRDHLPLLIKASFLQMVQAKFQLEIVRLEDYSDSRTWYARLKDGATALPEHLILIEKFLTRIETEVVGLLDEVDGTLSMKFAVHIPWGEATSLPPDEAGLIRDIYKVLITDEFNDKIKLLQNEQADLSHARYIKEILPLLVEQFEEHSKLEIGIPDDLKMAYRRYLQNTILQADQKLAEESVSLDELSPMVRENVRLLRFVWQSFLSENKVLKRRTRLIGLFRFFTHKVLPLALAFSYNRNYGPSEVGNGEVIPFIGVGVGGLNKFGFPYLSLALHLQAVLQGEIQVAEIAFLAEKMTLAAQRHAQDDERSYLATVEAQQFQKITGITLLEAQEERLLLKALDAINSTPQKKLAVRTQTAPFHVRFFEEEASCTANDLVKRFRHVIGCSATLPNHPTFHGDLGKPNLEKGTEGSILNLIETDKPFPILEIPDTSLESLLEAIKNHPERHKVRALFDSGAFLKTAPSTQFVAEKILDISDHIEAVLFLPSSGIQFVLLVREGNVIHHLKNTHFDEIAKYKIPLDKIFVLLDDLRTIGTDILMAPDTVCLQTLEPRLAISKHEQGLFRARQVFQNQKVIPVMTTLGRAELFHQGKTLCDLTHTEEKNEAIAISDETLTSYNDQLDCAYRMKIFAVLRDAIRRGDRDSVVRTAKEHRRALVNAPDFSRHNDWLRIESEESTRTFLQKRADQNPDLQPIVDRAARDPYLPPTVTRSSAQQMNLQVQLEQEVNVEIQLVREQNQQVERELQQELQTFQIKNGPSAYQEVDFYAFDWVWNHSEPVQHFLQHPHKKGRASLNTSIYSPLFSENLYLTSNLRFTAVQSLPVFHKDFKQAHFMLIQRDNQDQFRFALLSKNDAKNCKRIPPRKDTWVVGLDGVPLADGIASVPIHHPEVVKGLYEANLFNGNIDYLEREQDSIRPLMEGKRERCGRYLSLKNGFDQTQMRKVLKSSVVMMPRPSIDDVLDGGIVFSSRLKQLEKAYLDTRSAGEELLSILPSSQVPDIASHQVPWLTTGAQLSRLPLELLPYVTDKQLQLLTIQNHLHLIAGLPAERRPCLSHEVLLYLAEQEAVEPLSAPDVPDWMLRVLPKERYLPGTLELLPDSKFICLPTDMIEADPVYKIRFENYTSRLSSQELAGIWPSHVSLLPPKVIHDFTHELHPHLIERLSDRQLLQLSPKTIRENKLIEERIQLFILAMSHEDLRSIDGALLQHMKAERLDSLQKKLSWVQLREAYGQWGFMKTFLIGCYNVIRELVALPFLCILNMANLLFTTFGLPFSAQDRQAWWGTFTELFKPLARLCLAPISLVSQGSYVYLNCRLS